MRYKFYDSLEYRKMQAGKTMMSWRLGHHNSMLAPIEKRECRYDICEKQFEVKRYDPKQFCSSNCAASYNNRKRHGLVSLETRKKISEALQGRPNKYKGRILVPRLVKICSRCKKEFRTERWQNHKYCSARCAIRDTGSKITSPRAARGKSGIRSDVNPHICFYSRWEANFARILNLLKIKWEFQPRTFDLNFQKYTPDFYLPEEDAYVEIKNFLSDYSLNRDRGFRRLYPKSKLILILKEDYLKLQEEFSPQIKNWEFS